MYETLKRLEQSKKELIWYLMKSGSENPLTKILDNITPLPFEECDTNYLLRSSYDSAVETSKEVPSLSHPKYVIVLYSTLNSRMSIFQNCFLESVDCMSIDVIPT